MKKETSVAFEYCGLARHIAPYRAADVTKACVIWKIRRPALVQIDMASSAARILYIPARDIRSGHVALSARTGGRGIQDPARSRKEDAAYAEPRLNPSALRAIPRGRCTNVKSILKIRP